MLSHLAFKLTDQEVVGFYGRNATNPIPGAPNFDLRYAVDGQRKLTILKALPTSSAGRRFELRNRVIGIYDKGNSGSSFETEQRIIDAESGEVYAQTRTMNFLPGQGNWGGPRGKQTLSVYTFFRMTPRSMSLLRSTHAGTLISQPTRRRHTCGADH